MNPSPIGTERNKNRHLFTAALVLFTCVGCDQVSKRAAIAWLANEPTRRYLGDTFRLTYMENRGAFLGMGSDWPEPLRWVAFTLMSTLLVGVALLFVVRRIRQAHDLPLTAPVWGALMLAAGGVGNLIDRFYRDGAVVDFMNAGIGSLRTGIFNVADVQIMAGAVLLAFAQEVRKGDETPTSDVPPESRAG